MFNVRMSIEKMASNKIRIAMTKLRKIPLEPLIQILQDLFENGADFIDIAGEINSEGEESRDVVKITVRPEYMSDDDDENDDDEDIQNLSEDDIMNLMQ